MIAGLTAIPQGIKSCLPGIYKDKKVIPPAYERNI